MRTCVLLLRDAHYLNEAALAFCRSRLTLLAAAESRTLDEAALADTKPDVVLSFLCERILRGPLLRIPGINFHPAPPTYPGRGGASFALYEGAAEYGATAHMIERVVDSGPILAVSRFAISPSDNCETLFLRAEMAAWTLFCDIVTGLATTGRLPAPASERWQRPAITRAEFEAWLVLDPSDPEKMRKKIKAARHSRFPGPYVDLEGSRFTLCADQARDDVREGMS